MMQEIIKEPSNRFDYWIMREWKVLPTSPEFQNLTSDQKEFLWENFLLDNPEISKRLANRFVDEDFDKEFEKTEKAAVEAQDAYESKTDQDEIDAIEESYSRFTEQDGDLPDYREVLKAKGIVLDNEKLEDDDDWEEVD